MQKSSIFSIFFFVVCLEDRGESVAAVEVEVEVEDRAESEQSSAESDYGWKFV